MFAALVLLAVLAIAFSEARIDPCRLPIERGPCRGRFLRWGVDQQSGECVRFFYGGCGGNKNHFDSKEECESLCGIR